MPMHINTVVASVVSSSGSDTGSYAPPGAYRTHAPHERTRLISERPKDSVQAGQTEGGRRRSAASESTITYASALSGSESESERSSSLSSGTLMPVDELLFEPSRWAKCKRWLACVLCCHVPT